MMNIMVDLDGVVYAWPRAVYTEQCVYHNETRDYETFWQEFEKEHNALYFENLVKIKHLYGTQVPDERNIEFLHKLIRQGHTIYYVTNRPTEVMFDTKLWLDRWEFPQRENLIFAKDKIPVCNSLGIELVIEDRIKNVNMFYEAGFNVIAVKDAVTPKELYPCPVVDYFYQIERIMENARVSA